MQNQKKEFRQPVMDRLTPIWITQGSYDFLRSEKKRLKKSMQQILEDLIQEKASESLMISKK